VPNKLKIKLSTYSMIVFYSPRDIESLFENFPDFKQGLIKIAVFGEATYQMANKHNLDIEIQAPTDKFPSLSMALDHYFRLLKG